MMKAPRTLPLLVAAALLLGQLAGQVHAASHLDAGGVSKDPLAHTTLCAKCASFDNLSLLLAPSVAVGADVSPSDSQIGAAEYEFVRLACTPFQSRAPPPLG